MNCKFNYEKENTLENYWNKICENIEWLPLDDGIIVVFFLI